MLIFFNILTLFIQLQINYVLKPDLVSVVTAHMVYFCAFARSEIFQKCARKLGVGRWQFHAGVNGLIRLEIHTEKSLGHERSNCWQPYLSYAAQPGYGYGYGVWSQTGYGYTISPRSYQRCQLFLCEITVYRAP